MVYEDGCASAFASIAKYLRRAEARGDKLVITIITSTHRNLRKRTKKARHGRERALWINFAVPVMLLVNT